MTVRSRENFQFKIGQQKQRTVKSCAKLACHFFRRKAQLLKKSFLFYTKNTNQKNKGTS